MASAAKAKVDALFVNGQTAIVLCTTLQELGLPQPPTPIKTNNYTASGITNNTLSSNATPAPSICTFIGYKTEYNRDSLSYIGNLAPTI
jgi:hypothetical protein